MNTTKEGIEVLPGQTWKELDKRSNRIVTLIEISNGHATGTTRCGTVVSIPIKKMYSYSSGWQLC